MRWSKSPPLHISANRLRFDIHEGPEGAQTVVLSSGLGGSAGYWSANLPALTARHRVVTYDHRGCGRTGGSVPEGTTIADMADDLQEVLEASATPRAHIVGHALGGLIGLEMALRTPERVASLTLINAWSRVDGQSLRCFETRLALLDHAGVPAFVRAQPLFLYPGEWMAARPEHMAAEEAHGIAHFQGVENVKRRIAALAAFDRDDRLGEVAVPVLALATRDDLLVPWSRSARLAEGIAGARFVLEPEGAHAVNVTRPERFDTILADFLSNV